MDAGRGRILVIKLGALGDFVQALGPMAAIVWSTICAFVK